MSLVQMYTTHNTHIQSLRFSLLGFSCVCFALKMSLLSSIKTSLPLTSVVVVDSLLPLPLMDFLVAYWVKWSKGIITRQFRTLMWKAKCLDAGMPHFASGLSDFKSEMNWPSPSKKIHVMSLILAPFDLKMHEIDWRDLPPLYWFHPSSSVKMLSW